MSQRNDPERYSRQGKNDPQEHYSQSDRKWGWPRSRQASDADATSMPRIASISSVTALPTPHSASLANAASPAERMAAARYAAAPPQRVPDDTPALSTARKMGSALQRFSGTGVASLSAVQRQEQRARVITLSLVSVAVILVVVSAFLLFNPTVRHVGFGLAPGNRVVTVTSTAVSIIYQNPTPTPSVNQITPTPNPSGGNRPTATATPRPTAPPHPTPTPRPTPTPIPTATPIPYGGSATVTFMRMSQPITGSDVPANLTACSGCSINPAVGQIPDSYLTAGNRTVASSNSYGAAVQNPSGAITLTFMCSGSDFGCTVPSNVIIYSPSGEQCTTTNSVPMRVSGPQRSGTCTIAAGTGYHNFDFVGISLSNTEGMYCSPIIDQCVITVTSENPTSGGGYVMPNNCANYNGIGNNAQNIVNGQILASLNGGAAVTLAGPQVNALGYYCALSNCQSVNAGYYMPDRARDSRFWNCATANGWHLTYYPGDAITVQKQRIANVVRAGYVLDPASVNVCASPTVTSVDVAARTAQITCAASATAYYIWNGTNSNALQNSLKSNGSTFTTQPQATSICNSTPGIVPNSCVVTITGGSVMPQGAGNITINPKPSTP